MIELKNTHIGYTHTLFAIDDLTIKDRQLVSIIGPNGSGKTTFLNTILSITPPLKGILKLDGKNIHTIHRTEKVKLISHVASKFEGVPNLSVYELIAMGRAPYTNILNKLQANDKEVIEKVIDQLSLRDIQHKSTTSISDGERQIAMIGKALAQETKIIVLDEPTAFLDYNNRRKVLNLLGEIAHSDNKIILLSTHDIDLCVQYSDMILAVNKKLDNLLTFKSLTSKDQLIKEVFDL